MQEENINIYFDYIKKSKKTIFAIVGTFTTLTILYSFIMPFTYEANTTIMPPSSSSSGGGLSSFLANMSGGGLVLGGLGKSNSSLVYIDILKSYKNTKYIIEQLALDTVSYFEAPNGDELISNLQKSMFVTIEKSGVINIVSELKTPFFPSDYDKEQISNYSSLIVNKASEGLDKIMREFTHSKAKRSRVYIENELITYRKRLDLVSITLENFQTENKVLSLKEQTKAIVDQAITVQTELLTVGLELNLAQIQLNKNSPKVSVLQQQYDYLLKKSIDIQRGTDKENDFSIPLNSVPRLTRIYRDLYRDKGIIEKVILYLETQRHQEAIAEKKDVPLVEILDEAHKPLKRSAPQRKLMLILSIVISSLLSIFYLFIKVYFQKK